MRKADHTLPVCLIHVFMVLRGGVIHVPSHTAASVAPTPKKDNKHGLLCPFLLGQLSKRLPQQYQINATAVSDGGMRVDSVSSEREAMSSGSYRPGFCYCEGILPAGTYTIIVSTYKPGQVVYGCMMLDLCMYYRRGHCFVFCSTTRQSSLPYVQSAHENLLYPGGMLKTRLDLPPRPPAMQCIQQYAYNW